MNISPLLYTALLLVALTVPVHARPKFSIDPASPSVVGAVTPDDVLLPGPKLHTPGTAFGLLDDVSGGVFDNLGAFSYGKDPIVLPLYFSVDRVAAGLPQTTVFFDALPGVEAAAPSVYVTTPLGPARAIRHRALGLVRGPFGDDLDGLDIDQEPTPNTYFAIDRFSFTNDFGAADLQNDILVSDGDGAFGVFATHTEIGIAVGDALDGLVLDVAARTALFSLDPFSPSTFTFTGLEYAPCIPGRMSPADVCITHLQGSYDLWLEASGLGLRLDDNVDALDTIIGVLPEGSALTLTMIALAALGFVRRRITLPLTAAVAAASPAAMATDPPDPGKGFDYVFYGYDPALPRPLVEGFSTNRAMLLLDIDKPGSPRAYPQGPKFKLFSESNTGSGVLDVVTQTPATHTLVGAQLDPPVRFMFTFKGMTDGGTAFMLTSDALLEAYRQHYLRAVVDVVHGSRRTRYLVDCPTVVCDVPNRPYP